MKTKMLPLVLISKSLLGIVLSKVHVSRMREFQIRKSSICIFTIKETSVVCVGTLILHIKDLIESNRLVLKAARLGDIKDAGIIMRQKYFTVIELYFDVLSDCHNEARRSCIARLKSSAQWNGVGRESRRAYFIPPQSHESKSLQRVPISHHIHQTR